MNITVYCGANPGRDPEFIRRAAELEAAENAADAEGKAPAAPQLVLHKDSGCEFSDITLEDFEMLDYAPAKPQLRFELGI